MPLWIFAFQAVTIGMNLTAHRLPEKRALTVRRYRYLGLPINTQNKPQARMFQNFPSQLRVTPRMVKGT